MALFLGTAFDDYLVGTIDDDLMFGNAGDDLIFGGGGGDQISGEDGNDVLYGEAGSDILRGGGGNDYLNGGDGDNVLHGGAGSDRVSYYGGASGVRVSLAAQGIAQFTGRGWDTLIGIEHLTGTEFDDVLSGDDNANWLWGGVNLRTGATGNDQIDGGAGDDLIDIGAGNHSVFGGGGADTLSFYTTSQSVPAVILVGVTISLAAQGSSQWFGFGSVEASGFENLVGTVHEDVLTGDANDNWIGGAEGADTLFGGDGADVLSGDGAIRFSQNSGLIAPRQYFDANGADFIDGGAGDDTLIGEGGDDTLLAGEGFDQIWNGDGSDLVDAGEGDDIINIGSYWYGLAGSNPTLSGDDVVKGGAGVDTISFLAPDFLGVQFDLGIHSAQSVGQMTVTATAVENVVGSNGSDLLVGDNERNALSGAEGKDTLYGMDGDDHLSGDGDDDILDGGAGADFIVAGAGRDVLIGGDGADTFIFAHAEYGVIEDFESRVDTIQIAFFQGGYAGLTMYDDPSGNAVIEYTNDFGEHITIELTGVSSSALSTADFII